jgi:hypothetical protein
MLFVGEALPIHCRGRIMCSELVQSKPNREDSPSGELNYCC